MSRNLPVFLLFRNSENFRMCGARERVGRGARRTHARGGSIREAGRIKDLRSRV